MDIKRNLLPDTMPPLPVIGVDPGNTNTAVVKFDGKSIVYKARIPNDEAMEYLESELRKEKIPLYVEHIACYGMPVGASVFETCYYIGEIKKAVKMITNDPLLFNPVMRMDIKSFYCHSAKANDPAIRTSLVDLFGDKGVKKNPGFTFGVSADMWSALAIANYGLRHQLSLRKLISWPSIAQVPIGTINAPTLPVKTQIQSIL